jgi:hypothetical protein
MALFAITREIKLTSGNKKPVVLMFATPSANCASRSGRKNIPTINKDKKRNTKALKSFGRILAQKQK